MLLLRDNRTGAAVQERTDVAGSGPRSTIGGAPVTAGSRSRCGMGAAGGISSSNENQLLALDRHDLHLCVLKNYT
ncbi:hypothetical protein ACP70R_031375 [Stipagrostis hirtigluma subsp. patula]